MQLSLCVCVVLSSVDILSLTHWMLLQQIGQLKISLKSVQDQWSLYKRASEEINGYLMEGRYSVSRFRLLTGSLEAVQLQVQSLQVCQGEVIVYINDISLIVIRWYF